MYRQSATSILFRLTFGYSTGQDAIGYEEIANIKKAGEDPLPSVTPNM
jgi:hypothetical protein